MKKKKRYSKNEFRYNYNTKHTNFIFEEDGKNYHGIGLTHHSKTFGKKNIPLKYNPKKNCTEKAYLRNGIVTDKKKNYSSVDKRFRFNKFDMPFVKSKIRKYKATRKKYK